MINYDTPVLKIPNATPETSDAAQYMIYKGKKQYNLCGEFCVAYLMQDDAHTNNIDDFLNYWEAKDSKWYQTMFKDGLARTTSIYDLEKMLSAYDVVTPGIRFNSIKVDIFTVKSMLVYCQAVVGVQIDYQGYLVGKGIPHWVVLDRISVADSIHAVVDIYNPYTNKIEPYSWKELMTSMGAYKQGIWVAA